MIWLNGPFGVGKSTVAQILLGDLAPARLLDPEEIGFLLRRSLPVPTGDFQDLPAWRQLTVACARLVAEGHPGPADVVVPMTLVHPGYRREIHAGLRAAGLAVHEFALVAERATIASRIEADELIPDDGDRDAQARRWRLDRLDDTLAACRRLPPPTPVLDTTRQDPDQTAARILDALEAAPASQAQVSTEAR